MGHDSLALNDLGYRNVPEPTVLERKASDGGQVLLAEDVPLAGKRLCRPPSDDVVPDGDVSVLGEELALSGDGGAAGSAGTVDEDPTPGFAVESEVERGDIVLPR